MPGSASMPSFDSMKQPRQVRLGCIRQSPVRADMPPGSIMLKGAFSQSPGSDQELMPFVTQDVREMAWAEESSDACSGTSVSRSGDGGLSEQGFFEGRGGSTRWHAWGSFGAAVRAGKATAASPHGLSSPSGARGSGGTGGEGGKGERKKESLQTSQFLSPRSHSPWFWGRLFPTACLEGGRLLPARSQSSTRAAN